MFKRMLIAAMILSFAQVAEAFWGTGMYGGNSCPFPFQMAPGAFNPNDRVSNLRSRTTQTKRKIQDRKTKKRRLEERLRRAERDIDKVLGRRGVQALRDHYKGKRNRNDYYSCSAQRPGSGDRDDDWLTPFNTRPEDIGTSSREVDPTPDKSVTPNSAPPPPAPNKGVVPPDGGTVMISTGGGRMPAGEPPGERIGRGAGDNKDGIRVQDDAPYSARRQERGVRVPAEFCIQRNGRVHNYWGVFVEDGGRVSDSICEFGLAARRRPDSSSSRYCMSGLREFYEIQEELDTLNNEIADLEIAQRDQERDAERIRDEITEGTYNPYENSRRRGYGNSSTMDSLMPLVGTLAQVGIALMNRPKQPRMRHGGPPAFLPYRPQVLPPYGGYPGMGGVRPLPGVYPPLGGVPRPGGLLPGAPPMGGGAGMGMMPIAGGAPLGGLPGGGGSGMPFLPGAPSFGGTPGGQFYRPVGPMPMPQPIGGMPGGGFGGMPGMFPPSMPPMMPSFPQMPYAARVPGYMGSHNGMYGSMPGAIGPGGFGCNGSNPMAMNMPFMNSMYNPMFGGPNIYGNPFANNFMNPAMQNGLFNPGYGPAFMPYLNGGNPMMMGGNPMMNPYGMFDPFDPFNSMYGHNPYGFGNYNPFNPYGGGSPFMLPYNGAMYGNGLVNNALWGGAGVAPGVLPYGSPLGNFYMEMEYIKSRIRYIGGGSYWGGSAPPILPYPRYSVAPYYPSPGQQPTPYPQPLPRPTPTPRPPGR